jgi:hypothetical protein
VAVGEYMDTNENMQGLIETQNGAAWTATEAQLPANGYSVAVDGLDSIACVAEGSCEIAGGYNDTAGNTQGLFESLSDGSWIPTEAQLPGDANSQQFATLGPLACPVAGTCAAVGQYTDASGNQQGFIDTLSGAVWTPTDPPLPANSNGVANFSDIVCAAIGSCTAVGGYEETSTEGQGLIESQNGTTWTPTKAPLPGNAGTTQQAAQLQAVQCPSIQDCYAVGFFEDDNGNRQGLIVTTANLALRPDAAAPGATVKAKLTGFFANESVTVNWQTPTGTMLATATTDSSGKATINFTVPSVSSGAYTVYAVGADGPTVSATLNVT